MKQFTPLLIILLLASSIFTQCSKATENNFKPKLLITLRGDSADTIAGATVRLYKIPTDPGITQISDTAGVVIFENLDADFYFWDAVKDCKTNKNGQFKMAQALIPNAVLYGYSVMSETGRFVINNNSGEPYRISDSLYYSALKDTLTINDTPYVYYPKVADTFRFHAEKLSTPGVGKDTTVIIRCGQTFTLNLPF